MLLLDRGELLEQADLLTALLLLVKFCSLSWCHVTFLPFLVMMYKLTPSQISQQFKKMLLPKHSFFHFIFFWLFFRLLYKLKNSLQIVISCASVCKGFLLHVTLKARCKKLNGTRLAKHTRCTDRWWSKAPPSWTTWMIHPDGSAALRPTMWWTGRPSSHGGFSVVLFACCTSELCDRTRQEKKESFRMTEGVLNILEQEITRAYFDFSFKQLYWVKLSGAVEIWDCPSHRACVSVESCQPALWRSTSPSAFGAKCLITTNNSSQALMLKCF